MNKNKKTSNPPRKIKKKKILRIVLIISIVVLSLGILFFALFYGGKLFDIDSRIDLIDKVKENLVEIIKQDELRYIDKKNKSPKLDNLKWRHVKENHEQKKPPDYSDKDKNYLDKLMKQ